MHRECKREEKYKLRLSIPQCYGPPSEHSELNTVNLCRAPPLFSKEFRAH